MFLSYWLFELNDDSKSLNETWVFHQTSILSWLFGVPGNSSFMDYQVSKIMFQILILFSRNFGDANQLSYFSSR